MFNIDYIKTFGSIFFTSILFYSLCKKRHHLPLKCEDVLDEEKARKYIEEELSNTFIRKCYKCNKAYIKETGCNHITCSCGAQMCYICKKPYDPTHNTKA